MRVYHESAVMSILVALPAATRWPANSRMHAKVVSKRARGR